jgi:hypothetical protein
VDLPPPFSVCFLTHDPAAVEGVDKRLATIGEHAWAVTIDDFSRDLIGEPPRPRARRPPRDQLQLTVQRIRSEYLRPTRRNPLHGVALLDEVEIRWDGTSVSVSGAGLPVGTFEPLVDVRHRTAYRWGISECAHSRVACDVLQFDLAVIAAAMLIVRRCRNEGLPSPKHLFRALATSHHAKMAGSDANYVLLLDRTWEVSTGRPRSNSVADIVDAAARDLFGLTPAERAMVGGLAPSWSGTAPELLAASRALDAVTA